MVWYSKNSDYSLLQNGTILIIGLNRMAWIMRTVYSRICIIFLVLALPGTSALAVNNHFTAAIANKLAAPWVGNDLTGAPCRGDRQGYGPYDYRYRYKLYNELKWVEGAHFTRMVETLIRGKTGRDPYLDIDYTLRAWPNHHRALNSMTRYYFREKSAGNRVKLPPECYFQRALNFTPNDPTTYMLYGIYLQKVGRLQSAEEKYKKALEIEPEHAQANYNYGLLLVKLKQYAKAKEVAKRAYDQSYPLPGLRDMLTSVGHWP